MSADPIQEGRERATKYNGPGGEGFQNDGKLNAYQCQKCYAYAVTIDREPGVTPFITRCDNCGGEAKSGMYRVGPHHVPTHEWVRPETVDGLNAGTVEHIRNGGLIMRPINALTRRWTPAPRGRA